MYINIDNNKIFAYTANKKINSSLPTIIFIHGAANDHSVWGLQSRYFSYHGWNTVAVDLLGHGKSSSGSLKSIESYSKNLSKLIKQLDLKNITVVGHSMGSLIALDLAFIEKKRVNKIVLIGTCFPMDVSNELLKISKNDPVTCYEIINKFSFSKKAIFSASKNPGFCITEQSLKIMQRNNYENIYNDFLACKNYKLGLVRASSLNIDSLFLLGKKDLMTPVKNCTNLINSFKNPKSVILEETGHAIMLEEPNKVLDELIDFVE